MSSEKSSTLRVTRKSGSLSFTPSSRSTRSRTCLKGLPKLFESTFCQFLNTKSIEHFITCTSWKSECLFFTSPSTTSFAWQLWKYHNIIKYLPIKPLSMLTEWNPAGVKILKMKTYIITVKMYNIRTSLYPEIKWNYFYIDFGYLLSFVHHNKFCLFSSHSEKHNFSFK